MLRTLLRAMLFVVATCGVAGGCYNRNPPWIDLPRNENAGYVVSIRTFEDADAVAQPFKLAMSSTSRKEWRQQVLSAEQCKNVSVYQGVERLIIFYDEIVLDGLSAYSNDPTLPRPLLCDNQYDLCQQLKEDLQAEEHRLVPVCTYAG